MLRVTVGVAAGFVTMSVLVIATQVAMLKLLFRTVEGGEVDLLPPAYLLANAAASLFYAVVGGCISAAIGRRYEAPTILGALMLGMAIGSLVFRRAGQPIWYAALLPLVGAVVATMAGYRWLGVSAGPARGDRA